MRLTFFGSIISPLPLLLMPYPYQPTLINTSEYRLGKPLPPPNNGVNVYMNTSTISVSSMLFTNSFAVNALMPSIKLRDRAK